MKKILATLVIALFVVGNAVAQDELSFERKQAIDSLALEKVRDLSKYIKIAGSKDTPFSEANRVINETLGMFESNNVPVLIIISQAGGFNDYDRPTTIEKYLNYLKDQKISRNSVNDIKYNANGKISELELIKK